MFRSWSKELDGERETIWYKNTQPKQNSLMELEKQKYGITTFVNILASVLGVLFLFFILKEM